MENKVSVYIKIISSLIEEDDLNEGKYKVTCTIAYFNDAEFTSEVARSTEVLRAIPLDELGLPSLYAKILSKFSQ